MLAAAARGPLFGSFIVILHRCRRVLVAIADNGGSGGFTKANTGTLLLGSANTYAGDSTISSGTL
ncbi:MAG: autotransporter-associated beta strand repeat-containing protein, partial [Phycisphaerae bacterium]